MDYACESTIIALPDEHDDALRELSDEQRTTPRASTRLCRGCDGPADETCAECGAGLCVACDERCAACDAALCDPCAGRHLHVIAAQAVPDPELGRCAPAAACAMHRPCASHVAATA